MKIKYKIILIFGSLFAVFFLLSGHLLYTNSSKQLTKVNYDALNTRVTYRYKHLDSFINLNFDKLALISSRTQLRTLLNNYYNDPSEEERDKMRAILNDAKSSLNDFISITIIDDSGRVIVSTNKDSEGNVSGNYNKFLKNKTEKSIAVIKDNYQIPHLYLSGPVDFDGKQIGTIFVKMSLDKLSEITGSFGQTGEAYLADSEGFFLTQPRFLEKGAVMERKIDSPLFRQCLEDREKYLADENNDPVTLSNHNHFAGVFADYRGEEVIAQHLYVSKTDWCLIVKMDEIEAVSSARQLLFSFGLTAAASIVIYIFLAIFVVSGISKPIEKLNEDVQIIEKGNFDHKVAINSRDEIGILSRSFDKMVEAVKRSRNEIETKVNEQTKKIQENAKTLEDQRKAIFNVLEDVQLEKEIVQNERDKVDAIIHSIGDGVFVVNSDMHIILINKIALAMCGYSEKESLEKDYKKILRFEKENDPDNKVYDLFVRRAISTGKIQEMSNHTVLVNRNGEKIPVSDSAAPLVGKNGKITGCVVVFRDVSKEREIDRMKTEFLSVASHQLRTPLGSMRWNLEMLLSGDAGKLSEEAKEILKDIYESDKRIIDLVNDLLNISRIDQGRVSDEPIKTDISDVISTAIKEMEPIAEKKQVEIKYIKQSSPEIIIDAKRLREVIQNLLSNSVKYNKQKGKVEVVLKVDNGKVKISIQDTGMGIPKEDQNNIYAKFFRAQNAVKSETEGSGLGLFLVKSYIEGWGGKIDFESKEGEGSKFVITLPDHSKNHTLDANLKNDQHKLS